MSDVTRNDLDTMRDRIESVMREGFIGVNARLDRQNGRLGTAEVNIANLTPRLGHLEREMGEVGECLDGIRTQIGKVAETVASDARTVARAKEESGEHRRVSVWDVALVCGTVAAVVGFLKFMGMLQ